MTASFHPDWRDWIAKKLRRKIKREKRREPARPYLMRSLDKFERLVPHLSLKEETCFQLEAVCDLVNKEGDDEVWSLNSASRFLHYLDDIGILSLRYAGRSGNAISLLKNLAVAPDPSRQSGAGQIPRPKPKIQGEKKEEAAPSIPREVEFDPMPASPANMNPPRCYAPEPADPEETVELDGGAVLAAIDQITERLGAINLSFRTELSSDAAAVAYTAQTVISQAMTDLQRLRTAVQRGDGAPLAEILDGE